jgi:CYTH domain-containing protein
MSIEIERKFLVANDGWRRRFVRMQRIRDGLVAATDDRKVRVRICDERATIAVKAKREGFTDAEFEYEIPKGDAEEMLASYCGQQLTKRRYDVPYRGHTWQVDVYEGLLEGVILADVELPRADIDVPLPDWVGTEVTGRPEYKKRNMLAARLSRVRMA